MIERRPLLDFFSHLVLIIGVLIVAFPIYVAVVASTQTAQEAASAPLSLTPAEVYGKPATTFVASFIGSPPMNLLTGRFAADRSHFDLGDGMTIALPPASTPVAAQDCVLGLRPEHLVLGRPGLLLDVELVEALGADLLVHARIAGQSLVIRAPAGTPVAAEQRVEAGFEPSAMHWFDAATTSRLEI